MITRTDFVYFFEFYFNLISEKKNHFNKKKKNNNYIKFYIKFIVHYRRSLIENIA